MFLTSVRPWVYVVKDKCRPMSVVDRDGGEAQVAYYDRGIMLSENAENGFWDLSSTINSTVSVRSKNSYSTRPHRSMHLSYSLLEQIQTA